MRTVLALLAVCLLGIASSAFAEPYVALYLGASIPMETDLENAPVATSLVPLVVESRTLTDVELDTSLAFGGKFGLWHEDLPLVGVEIDIYHRTPDIDEQTVKSTLGEDVLVSKSDLDVTTFALHLMGRYPFGTDRAFPRGRFQLYGGVGLGIFLASFDDADDTRFGLEVLAGAKYFLTRNWGAFGEYKFAHASEFKFATSVGDMGVQLTENILSVGVAYHF